MYAYLFLFLFTIGAGTAASVGIMNINNKSHETTKALEDVRIISLWETNIGDALEYAGPSNELVPPLGTNQAGKNGVHYPPSWIVAPRNNAYGKSIVYCPVSRTAVLNDKLGSKSISNQGEDYSANTTVYKNKEYVIASNVKLDPSIPRSSALAFIISPGPQENPKCSDVVYNASKGYFYLNGNSGIVRVVTPAHKINHGQEELPPSDEAKDISALINEWAKTSDKNLVVEVNSKDYFNNSVSVTKFDADNSIILKSASGNLVKLNSNGASLSLNGVKLFSDGIDASNLGQISVENGSMILNNSNTPNIAIASSSLSAYGNNELESLSSLNSNLNFNGTRASINTKNDTVAIKNSRVNIYNGAVVSIDVKNGSLPLSLTGNSDLYIEGSTLNLKGTNGYAEGMILNDATSRLSSVGSTINLNSRSVYGIYSQGMLSFDNTILLPNSSTTTAVYITDGSKARLNSTNIGSSSKKALYGVIVDSTSFTSGSGSNIYSSYTCLSGAGYNASKSLPDKTTINIQWACK